MVFPHTKIPSKLKLNSAWNENDPAPQPRPRPPPPLPAPAARAAPRNIFNAAVGLHPHAPGISRGLRVTHVYVPMTGNVG